MRSAGPEMGRSHTYSIVAGVPFEAVVVYYRKHIVPQKCSYCSALRNRLLDHSDKWSYDLEQPFSKTSRIQVDPDLCAWESPHNVQFFKSDTSSKPKSAKNQSKKCYGYRNVNTTEFKFETQDQDTPVTLKYSHDSSPYTRVTQEKAKISDQESSSYKISGKEIIDTVITLPDGYKEQLNSQLILPKIVTREKQCVHQAPSNVHLPSVTQSEPSAQLKLERYRNPKSYVQASTKHALRQTQGDGGLRKHQRKHIERATYKLTKLDTHDFCHCGDRRLHLQHYKFRSVNSCDRRLHLQHYKFRSVNLCDYSRHLQHYKFRSVNLYDYSLHLQHYKFRSVNLCHYSLHLQHYKFRSVNLCDYNLHLRQYKFRSVNICKIHLHLQHYKFRSVNSCDYNLHLQHYKFRSVNLCDYNLHLQHYKFRSVNLCDYNLHLQHHKFRSVNLCGYRLQMQHKFRSVYPCDHSLHLQHYKFRWVIKECIIALGGYFGFAIIRNMKDTPRTVLKKGVPHQFSSGWEIFSK